MWDHARFDQNPVFATMVMVGIVVLGLFSYARLRVEQMPGRHLALCAGPDRLSGRLPEVVETDVSKPHRICRQHRVGRRSGSVRTRGKATARSSSSFAKAPT